MFLLAVLFFFFYVYAAGYIIYLITLLIRKKKVPRGLIAMQIISIAAFFYLQHLVENHQIIFIGMYGDGTEHWGTGLANVYIAAYNQAILIAIFIVLQLLISFLFSRRIKHLRTLDITKDFLNNPD